MQLEDPLLDNNSGTNWCVAHQPWPGSTGDLGTPGSANDCRRPVSLTISKNVDTGQRPVLPGNPLTYTVAVSNDGEVDAGSVVVTDTLPAGLVGEDLIWSGTIAAGERVEFTIPAVITTEVALHGQTITNTAFFHHPDASGSSSVTFTVGRAWHLYLPLWHISSSQPPPFEVLDGQGPAAMRHSR